MSDTRIYDQVYRVLLAIRLDLRNERDQDKGEGSETVYFRLGEPVDGSPVVIRADDEYDMEAKCLVRWDYDNSTLRTRSREVSESLDE